MSISKKFYSIVLAILAVFTLVGCDMSGNGGGDVEPVEGVTLSDAQALVNKAMGKIQFLEADRISVTQDLVFASSNPFAPGVTISWSSANTDVITNDGKVTRPVYGQGNATVTVTATFSMPYNVDDAGNAVDKVYTDTKSWDFIVIEAGEVFTLSVLKNKIAAGELEKDSEVTFTAVIIGKITGTQFIAYDGTEAIYVHTATDLPVGTEVEISGKLDVYYEIWQIAKDATVTAVNENATLPAVGKTTISAVIADSFIGASSNPLIGGFVANVDAIVDVQVDGSYTNVYLVDPKNGEKFLVYYKTAFEYVAGYAEGNTYIDVLKPYHGKTVNITVALYDLKDKDNRMLLTGYPITEIEDIVLTDDEQAQFNLNGLSLEANYTETFTLPTADGVVWTVKEGTGIVIEEGKAVVTRAAEDQTVVLTATATVNQAVATKDFTVVVTKFAAPTFEVGKAYNLQMVQEKAGKTLYMTGAMNGYYFGTTEDVTAACEVKVLAADGGYYIVAKDQYVAILQTFDEAQNKTFTNVKFYASLEEATTAGASVVWTWNGTDLITDVKGSSYLLGTQASGTYTTISAVKVGTAAFAVKFVEIAGSETPDTPEKPSFELDKPYHFQMVQENAGKTLYLTGAMDGYYFATTEDVTAACEVVIKAADGGYYIIAKGQYVAIYSNYDAAQDKTFINVKFYASLEVADEGASVVWTWNGEHFITSVDGVEYLLGTRNDKSYLTFSACKVTSGSFKGTLVEIAGSETPENPDTPENPENPDTPVVPGAITSITEALSAAKDSQVVLTGTVSGIYQAYSDQYKNVSVYIKDASGAEILAFRMTGDQAATLSVGDIITVTGTIGVFNEVNQIAAGCTFVMVTVHTCVYSEATCKAPATCTLCKVAKDEVLADHDYVEGVCSVCGASEGSSNVELVTVTLKHSESKTANMSGSNDAAKFGLDASIFTVTSAKNSSQQHIGLNASGYLALYSVRASGDGNTLTIKVAEGYTIQNITINWGTGSNGTATFTVNGVESTKATTDYVINGNEIVIKNTFCDSSASKNAQLWINSIEITYFAN